MYNVLITGGTRGIGRAIVSNLLSKGYRVAYTYKNSNSLASEIDLESKEKGTIAVGYKVDVCDRTAVKKMISDIYLQWGSIDILINNAGIVKDKSLAMMTYEEWDDVIMTNLYGVFNLTRECIFSMLKRKEGRIINISSISGIYGIKGQVNYSSSKAAIIGFTKSLAKEVAHFGVTVNCVAPGGVETEMTSKLTEIELKKLIQDVPLQRLCKPEEVAKVVEFLVDKEQCPQYLTGVVIPLDGGIGL